MKKTVSIIIPVFNALPYLKECLDSIVIQDYKQKEIILIDNSSTDGSSEVCQCYYDRFDFIHLIRTDLLSIGEARNLGLEIASGEYIMFVDADDYLPSKYVISWLEKKISSSDSDICVGNYSRLWGNELLEATSHRTFSLYPQDGHDFLFTGFFSVDVLSYVWSKIYRKEFIRRNNLAFSDCRYAEDKLFNLQAAAFKAKYSFLCRDVYVHRYNPKSVSFNYRPDPHLIWLGIAYKLKYTFDKGIPSPLWKQMIAYTIFFGCFFDSKMVYLHSGKKISAIKELLVEYSRDPLSTTSFKMLSDNRNLNRIPSFLYRIFIGGFAFFMKRHMFSAIAIGIKIIIDTKIDERLSDTGKKPHK